MQQKLQYEAPKVEILGTHAEIVQQNRVSDVGDGGYDAGDMVLLTYGS